MPFFQKKQAETAQQPASGIRREVCVFSLLYLIFFVLIFLPPILRNGAILGGDGKSMYYPTLINFRHTMLEFGRSIKEGHPSFPMINFDFAFGGDNTTMLANYLGLFPFFIFSVLMPESWLATFLTSSVFLLDFLAGIAFLQLCRHFGHSSPWNALMALAYALNTEFLSTALYNPQFMYMYIAFPLMVIGIDRVIHKTGWKLLAVNVFWLCLTSFTFLAYTLPFLAIFALIRVWFCQREHFVKNLLSAFFRSMAVLICGILLACVLMLPTLYLLKNSIRSSDEAGITLAELLVPEVTRLSSCFHSTPYMVSIFFVIPGLLITMLLLPKRTELKTYLLASVAVIAVPFFDYASNGFQYSLVRWEFIPALVFAYAASVGMEALPKLNRKKLGFLVFLMILYWITFSSSYDLHYEAGDFCSVFFAAAAVCAAIPPVRRLLVRALNAAGRGICRFFALLKGKEPSVKRYLALAVTALGAVGLIICGVLLVLLPDYLFHITFIPVCLMTILAALLCCIKKPRILKTVMPLLALCYFGSAVYLFWGYRNSNTGDVNQPELIGMIKSLPEQADSFNRSVMIEPVQGVDTSASTDGTDQDPAVLLGLIPVDSKGNHSLNISNDSSRPQDTPYPEPAAGTIECNFSMVSRLPDINVFHNLLDRDVHDLLERCGNSRDYTSLTAVFGLDEKPLLHTLFGVSRIGYEGGSAPKHTYGQHEVSRSESESGDDVTLYQYDYALPVGVTYDSYTTEAEFDAAGCTVLPYLMLNSAYTENNRNATEGKLAALEAYACDVTHKKTYVKENSLGMEVYQHELTLNRDVSGCFLYLEASDVHCRYPEFFGAKVLKINADGKPYENCLILNENCSWPWQRKATRYSFNLGYQEESLHTLSFEFSAEYGDMKLYAIPASVLTEGYAARTAEALRNVTLGKNALDGDITVSGEKLLSVSLIHNDGWRVYVDGTEQPLEKVNRIFLGVMLPAGTHHVRFVYRTPWLTAGLLCSGAGVLLWIALCFLYRQKKKEQAA